MMSPVKKQLRVTWGTFFSKFSGLTPVQEKVIPQILKKRNLLVISPTASGKTEAVTAPVCEMVLSGHLPPNNLYILYIAPTKALVNDLFERLNSRITGLGIFCERKTGDHSYYLKKGKYDNNQIPGFLFTTPESLDSVLCRSPDILKTVRFVIIDEIHVLDSTARGDQLRVLLNRLSRIADSYQTILMSATVADPEGVAGRYTDKFKVVNEGKNKKEFQTKIFYVSSPAEIYETMKSENLKKVLIFCNSRSGAENCSLVMKDVYPQKNCVVTHHGSISKTEREHTEAFMRNTSYGICVSTNTLEVGIDIGNIDAVVLYDVPKNVSSFIQKIGRAGRRSGNRCVLMNCRNERDKELFEEYYERAVTIGPDYVEYYIDPTVVVQQIFSIVASSPSGISYENVIRVFNGFCSRDLVDFIMGHLIENGWILNRNNRLFASTEIMDMYEKGTVHSNVPNSIDAVVINNHTKQEIGRIFYYADSKYFLLGGNVWEVVNVSRSRVYAVPSRKEYADAVFSSHGGSPFSGYMPPKIPVDLITDELNDD